MSEKEEETPTSTETDKEEKTPTEDKDPLWFIYDENVNMEGSFRSTVPSSRSGAEKNEFSFQKTDEKRGRCPIWIS